MSKNSRRWMVGLSVGLAIVLFLATNVIAGNWFGASRVDLTENRLYSLSQGSQALLADLDEPIHMRLFLSEGLVQSAPQLASYANRVRSMLETYAELSGGKIVLEVIDPQPFSDEEDRAVGLGVDRFVVAGAPDPLFFGLAATNSTSGKAAIPVFSPERERFLEYDLTRLVAELAQPDKPVVAILDGLGLAGDPATRAGEQQVLVQLRELFDVEFISGDVDALPDNTRVVMVVHPQDLSERTLYTLDQWVLSGGATMVFVDPYAETQPGPQPGLPPVDPSSNLERLFAAWGVGFDDSKAVGDPAGALRVRRQIGERDTEVTNYPWIAVRGEGMDRADAILSQLSSIVLTTAGSFTVTDEDTVLTPLLTASADAGLIDAESAADRFGDPRALLAGLERPDARPILAARVSGQFATAFPEGKPEGSEAEGEQLTALAEPANLIVVGDADMLMDRNWVDYGRLFGQTIARTFANNGDFVINAVEQMVGGAGLADLRGRGVSWRPFERIAELEKEAESRFLAKEQELLERLRQTEKKIRELDVAGEGDSEIVSADSVEAVDQYRSELLATRAELRQVRYELRRDVERLKTWVTVANVGVVPVVLAALAVILALWRPNRPLPKRSQAAAP